MYNKRTFIASSEIPSTSSVVCYCGRPSWHDKDRPEYVEKFVEISSCGNKVRLHQVDVESDVQYIEKLILLRTELDEYVEFLKTRQSNE